MHIVQTQIFPMRSALGEGPIWHRYRGSWCWFDVLHQNLFEVAHDDFANVTPVKHDLPFIATAMAVVDSVSIIMATDIGIVWYDLTTADFKVVSPLRLARDMRTNEGGMGPDGRFWFSLMEKSPSGLNGSILSCGPQFKIENHIEGVGIPNTMVWSQAADKYYVSDSFQSKTFVYDYRDKRVCADSQESFLDFSEMVGTPDGGALDTLGNLWVALWGGYKVGCFNPKGLLVTEIVLPVPQPSSCCFGGPHGTHLFITSARDSMTDDNLAKYPLSGSVFMAEVGVQGVEIPDFEMDESYVGQRYNTNLQRRKVSGPATECR
jgi:sugar lactone lactonase YvrE